MRSSKNLIIPAFVCLVGGMSPLGAMAGDTYTWDFVTGCVKVGGDNCYQGDGNEKHSRTFDNTTGSGPQVVATGWASWGDSDDPNNNTATSDSLIADKLTIWSSGLGMENRPESESDPEHAFDNQDLFELVMFDFGTEITLTDIQLGYVTDGDVSLLAYDATSGGTWNPDGVIYTTANEDLTDNGWEFVGNYDLTTSTTAVNITNPKFASQYWIVAAHNTVFGTSCEYDTSCGSIYDHYKVRSVTGFTSDHEVPVPSTLLLAGLGLAWFGRRKASSL